MPIEATKYKGYAQSIGFDPIRAPDTTRREAIEGERVLRGMERNASTMERTRDQYLAGLERKQSLEEQNRRQLNQYDQQNRARIQQGQLQNIKAKEGMEQSSFPQDLQALAGFSETISKVLENEYQRRGENELWEEYNRTYVEGLSTDEKTEFETLSSVAADEDRKINAVADQLDRAGAPIETTLSMRKLTAFQRKGRAQATAELASLKYGSWLQEQFENNTQPVIDIDGKKISPQEAALSPRTQAAATEVLWRQFMTQNGLYGMNPKLLAPAFQQMKQQEMQILQAGRKQYSISQSKELEENALSSLVLGLKDGSDPGDTIKASLNSLSVTLDENGKKRGFGGARDVVLGQLKNLIGTGLVNGSVLDDWAATPTDDQPNKTFGERFPAFFELARKDIQSYEREQQQLERQEKALEMESSTTAFIQQNAKTPATQEEIDEFIKAQLIQFGRYDPRLDEIARKFSFEAISTEALDKEFELKFRSGLLDPKELEDSRVPLELRDKWMARSQELQKRRSESGDFKAAFKAIEARINLVADYNPASANSAMVPFATAQAQAMFERFVSEGVAAGNPNAVNDALQQVLTMVDASRTDATSPFYGLKDDVLPNILPSGTSAAASRKNNAQLISSVDRLIASQGSRALDRQRLIPSGELTATADAWGKPGWKPGPMAEYISRKTGGKVSPFEVINRQLIARGMPPLELNPLQSQALQGIRPEYQRLMNYQSSDRRISRAMASAASFNPATIPMGLGQTILQASQQYNIPPGLLAGLIDAESGWNSRAVSRSGAKGLAQFMPGTALEQGVNVNDPKSSILGAAKYLNHLRKQFGGSLNSAIIAYNGGIGNISRNGGRAMQDVKENREYLPKVLRMAAKYGYSPSGNVWSNPGLMNPRLVYKIDTLGYGSTGPHLDVKPVQKGSLQSDSSQRYKKGTLDPWVKVKVGGKLVPLSKGSQTTDDDAAHRRRGSFGHDYAAPKGTEVHLTNGARVVSSRPGEEGSTIMTIEVPDGRRFQFIHGRAT